MSVSEPKDFELQARLWDERARAAQASAAQAYARLLQLAEDSDTVQARTIAHFVASTFDGMSFPLDPFDLRSVNVGISDDMLACLDALRWGKADLYKLVPDGRERILAMLKAWDLQWPGSSPQN
jgi:hypothetical protein